MIPALLITAAVLLLILLAIGKVPLRYNVRNLTVRWKTTAMTGLAFTLVIAVLTVMLAFVDGMRRLTEGTGRPGNVLIVAESATDEAFSNLNTADLPEIEAQPEVLRDPQGRPLASRETYLVINQPIPHAPPGAPKRRFLQVRGITDPGISAQVHELRLRAGGSWFSQAGVQPIPQDPAGRSAIQAVLGEGVARELARDRSPAEQAAAQNPQRLDVGDTFILGNRTWIVVGVMESAGSTFNSELWAKQSLVAPIFGKETFTTLVVRTRDPAAAEQFRDFLNAKTDDAAKPGGPPRARYKKAAVTAQLETDYYASLSATNEQLLWSIAVVTVFISIGGVFGVMNTMFAAVSQRTKDIGMLRLLGYARWQILVSFLLESLLIGLAGGLLGCALGMTADGWTATSIVGSHQGGGKFVVLTLVVDANTLAVGILLTLIMGTMGGLLPALSAMRLRALEALR